MVTTTNNFRGLDNPTLGWVFEDSKGRKVTDHGSLYVFKNITQGRGVLIDLVPYLKFGVRIVPITAFPHEDGEGNVTENFQSLVCLCGDESYTLEWAGDWDALSEYDAEEMAERLSTTRALQYAGLDQTLECFCGDGQANCGSPPCTVCQAAGKGPFGKELV